MSDDTSRLVSVVIPARNEIRDIDGCLDSVLALEYPVADLEVIVVDGGSTDGTGDRARERLGRSNLRQWKVVDNPVGATPSNLNAALRHATGRYVCRVDARSRIPAHYATRCVELLASRPELKVVGGAQVAVPPSTTTMGRGIARALNNRYTMGLSRYRRGATSGTSDTVYLGFFRTDDVRDVGGWDESLPTNQDFDLNQRLGGTDGVWFEAGIDVEYIPRSTLRALWQQYDRFGRWKVRYWRHTGTRPQTRQLVFLAAPVAAGSAAVAAIAACPRSWRPALVGVGIAGAVALDALGGRGRPADGPTRCVSMAASGAVAAGWVTGVWRELLGGRHD